MEHRGPTMKNIDRKDPAYLNAVIQKKSQNDPKEVAIRQKIEHCMRGEKWSVDALQQADQVQKKYLRDSIAHVSDEAYVYESTQSVLRELSGIMRSSIVEGADLLD